MHKKTVKQLIRRIFCTVTAALLAALLMTGAPCTAIPAFAAADFYTGRAASGMPDFRALQAQNPDIYAWLYIPGTDINYPVCQSTNDVYYLTHNTQGGLDANGALYTESAYNGKGFTDPVTVIYGHNMRSGKMFGNLEETFCRGLDGHSEAIVYMPGNIQKYKIFAALPIGSNHLMYGRNYYKKDQYQSLLDDIMKTITKE